MAISYSRSLARVSLTAALLSTALAGCSAAPSEGEGELRARLSSAECAGAAPWAANTAYATGAKASYK
ncbi:hypothetical protein EON77_21725, partial [bacterium]